LPVEQLYNELELKVRALRPNEDLAPLLEAFEFANKQHEGQFRDSGDPYMAHPLNVSLILADMQMDMVCLETGLLHDVVEDCLVTQEDISKRFGAEVARCVDGVTKLSKLSLNSREERQAESMRKMLLAMTSDIRVIIVKLADRLHNMRTLGSISRERQQRIAQETLDIYAPIAHRLGMGKIRGELEDLSFMHLEPEAYGDLVREMESRRQTNVEALERIRHDVEIKLARENIPARVEGRLKRAFSVYQKLKRQKINIDQVYDLMALRIITDSVKNCYGALGVIHNEWHPIPGRIKDYVGNGSGRPCVRSADSHG
jgi:GTP diphosphokinase / guanosine-3',5'-bis(diphosphate) 3'-diphosphatase